MKAFPDNWTPTPLAEVVKCQGGSAFSPALQGRGSGDIPFFKVSDMNLPENQWIMRRANNYVVTEETALISGHEKPAEATIFPKVGAAIHTNKKRLLSRSSFVDNNVMAAWSLDTDRCRSKYLYLYFLTVSLSDLSTPGPLPSINNSKIYENTIVLPPAPEQDRIVAVLWTVRSAIEVEARLVETTRELKRAAMTHLFAHGTRREPSRDSELGALPISWDVQPLGELREFLQYGTSVKCDYAVPGNPVLRIPNVIDGALDASDLKYCQLRPSEIESLLLAPGDVLFIRTNGVRERVGRCAVYSGTPEQALFASYLIRARLKQDRLNPHFLQYYTSTPEGARFLGGRASPAADGKFNVNTKTIDSVLVPLPTLDEQVEIVSILQQIDDSLAVHDRRRSALEELFSAMLDKLVSGGIRVDKLEMDEAGLAAA
jgi:type I restriction enzyme, S subunit